MPFRTIQWDQRKQQLWIIHGTHPSSGNSTILSCKGRRMVLHHGQGMRHKDLRKTKVWGYRFTYFLGEPTKWWRGRWDSLVIISFIRAMVEEIPVLLEECFLAYCCSAPSERSSSGIDRPRMRPAVDLSNGEAILLNKWIGTLLILSSFIYKWERRSGPCVVCVYDANQSLAYK